MADWMAFHVADYTANTLHLTTRQHGAYILLICAAWTGKGTLPGADASLMAITKLSPREWQTDGSVIKAFLTRSDDVWVHERVEFEWNEAQAIIAAKSKAGKEGARRRWHGRANGKAMAVPSDSHRQTDAPIPVPKPIPDDERSSVAKATAPPLADAVDMFNRAAEQNDWPKVQSVNKARKRALAGCLKAIGGLDGWQGLLAKVTASDFLMGRTPRSDDHANWRFDFDFLTKPKRYTKLMEGGYDNSNRAVVAQETWNDRRIRLARAAVKAVP